MEQLFYLAKVGILYAVLYSIYFLFFRNNTNFQANRIYLLIIIPLSFVLPFININIGLTSEFQVNLPAIEINTLKRITSAGFDWETWIISLYVLVSGVLLSFFFVNFIKTVRIILHIKQGKQVDCAPFSFFSFIHIPSYIKEEDRAAIVYHEQTHSTQWHSLDIMIYEISKVLLWWNPLIWMGLHSVKSNHEFIADKLASEKADKYSSVLVAQLLGVNCSVLANNFNYEPLIKKRIMMMKIKKSNRLSIFKYALVVPVITFSVFATAQKEGKEVVNSNHVVKEGKVYDKVDVMPEFNGGMDALINYMVTNINYPEAAKEKNIEGKVLVGFMVDAKGNIKEVKVVESVDELLDKEAVRVVENMPKWKPGEKDGKKVNVEMTLPISFKL
ncbi:MAG: TonB family protein [Vicingus serpentipes]|nr:TonB family protein [Vicingus serpentipes]